MIKNTSQTLTTSTATTPPPPPLLSPIISHHHDNTTEHHQHQTPTNHHHVMKNSVSNKKKLNFNSIYLPFLLICSIISLVTAILLIRYNIFDILMEERIKMSPGTLSYETWRQPEMKILIKTYIFSINNSKEFETGLHKKLQLNEIGPIVYEQTITQEDIIFEKDSTLSYTTVRKFRFLPEFSEPNILNKSIIIVNPLLLPIAAATNKMPLSTLLAPLDDVFLNRTIYQTLWECSSTLLDVSKKLFSIFLPTNNCGILYNAFAPRRERYNVRIGTENGFKNFWKINTINGYSKVGPYTESDYRKCPSLSVVNGTDGTGFPPYFNEKTIKLATARIPRTFDLDFDSIVQKNRLTAHKFLFSRSNFIRSNDTTKNCLRKCGNFNLPDGLIDASTIAYNMPVAISNPHFYGFTGNWNNYLEGIAPDTNKHSSYMLLEPKTGFPLEAKASIQCNIPVPEITYIHKLKKFSNKIIPTFWIEQSFMNNGNEFTIELMVNYLPIAQTTLIVLFFIISLLFYVKFILILRNNKKKSLLLRCSNTNLKQEMIFSSSIISDKLDLEKNIII